MWVNPYILYSKIHNTVKYEETKLFSYIDRTTSISWFSNYWMSSFFTNSWITLHVKTLTNNFLVIDLKNEVGRLWEICLKSFLFSSGRTPSTRTSPAPWWTCSPSSPSASRSYRSWSVWTLVSGTDTCIGLQWRW